MQNSIDAAQDKIDLELEMVENNIRLWLMQVESVFRHHSASGSEAIQLALHCRKTLVKSRMQRNKLLTYRTLFDAISAN